MNMNSTEFLEHLKKFSYNLTIVQKALASTQTQEKAKEWLVRYFRRNVFNYFNFSEAEEKVVQEIIREDSLFIDMYWKDKGLGFNGLRKKMEEKFGINSPTIEVVTPIVAQENSQNVHQATDLHISDEAVPPQIDTDVDVESCFHTFDDSDDGLDATYGRFPEDGVETKPAGIEHTFVEHNESPSKESEPQQNLLLLGKLFILSLGINRSNYSMEISRKFREAKIDISDEDFELFISWFRENFYNTLEPDNDIPF